MTKYLSLISLLTVFLFSTACIDDPKSADEPTSLVFEDTLNYTLERLSQTEEACVGDTCAAIQINFIQFQSGTDSLAIRQLNQTILNSFRGRDYTNVIAYINGFVREYAQDKERFPDMPKWFEESNQTVVFNHPKLVGLKTEMYSYRGGAHAIYATIFDNYDPKTGNALTWKDLLQVGEEGALVELGESYFRTTYKLASSESLADSEFSFEKDAFYLPENFVFDENGMTFLYGLYEIAAYVDGEQTFTIPYKEVRSLLKEEIQSLLP